MNREKLTKALIGTGIGVIGMVITIHTLGWVAAIGIFVLMWGNNLSQDI